MNGCDGIVYSIGDILIWFKGTHTIRFIFPYEVLSIVGRFDLIPDNTYICDYVCLEITGLYYRPKKLISGYLLKYLFFHTLHSIDFNVIRYSIVRFPINSNTRATLIEFLKKNGRLIRKPLF